VTDAPLVTDPAAAAVSTAGFTVGGDRESTDAAAVRLTAGAALRVGRPRVFVSSPGDWQVLLWSATREQQTAFDSVEAGWREHRQHTKQAAVRATASHRADYHARLDRATSQHARGLLPALLEDIALKHGLAWADLARVVGVSVPALRKWRKGLGDASGDNRRRVARLLAFLDLLRDTCGVAEPATWLNVPLVDGFTVTPLLAYPRDDQQAARGLPLLLDHASGAISATEALDAIQSDWREKYQRHFEWFDDSDGQPSLRSVSTR